MVGQPLARLIFEEGSSPVEDEFYLSELPAVIGRMSGVQIQINDKRISRQHARISREGDRFLVEDLGSRNGTTVNGEKISAPRELRSGDQLGLGGSVLLRFKVDRPPPVETAAETRKPAFDPSQMTVIAADLADPTGPVSALVEESPRLIITMPDGQVIAHSLTSTEVTIGRTDDNDITVNSPFVSRKQMRLARQGSGYVLLVNEAASNPVIYDDIPLKGQLTLRNGDSFQIAPTVAGQTVTFRYEVPAPKYRPTMIASKPVPSRSETIVAADLDEFRDEPTLGDPIEMGTIVTSDPMARPGTGTETIVQSGPLPLPPISAMLVVSLPGGEPTIHQIKGDRVSVGRAEDNDIVIDHYAVSRHHAHLTRVLDGYQLVPDPQTANPTFLDGTPISQPSRLKHGSKLRIDGRAPGEMVTIVYLVSGRAAEAERSESIAFGENNIITIGRDKENDITLDAPTVSRFHAQVERVGQRYRIRDLRSANGTFVNDVAIEGEVWLKPDDTIRIGTHRFVVGEDQLAQYDESRGMHVEVLGLNKWVRKDLNILQDISLVFNRRELVVVVGQSGGGKSTLVDAIAGYRPATHGKVVVNGIDVYKNFDAIRHSIGFVPQRDIIHMELTVFEALDFAAQLRMPSDTSREERHQRVMEVMEDLDLVHRRDVQINGLSGGQQKRVSIGVELLTRPGLFFLDEPTSGLDPGTETALMQLMRRLADQGRTIILITHATKNVMLADKVVFLARGGYLAWFGPPEEALAYFDQFRSDRDRRSKEIEFDDIYNLLDNPQMGSAADWANRYAQHTAHEKYVSDALAHRPAAPAAADVAPAAKRRRQVSSMRQFLILSARNLKIITRDRFSLLLMLLAGPIIATLDFVLATGLGKNPYSFQEGDMNSVVVAVNLLVNNAVLVAGLSQMRELVKEREIYRRERLVNLKLLPYIASKLWVAGLLGVYQAAVFVLIHNFAYELPGGASELGLIYLTILLLSLAGMMLGLFASALSPTANASPLILILFLIPQIVLNGALVPLPEAATSPVSSRWAFQAILAITGPGSDVAQDVCWDLTEEEQGLMTRDQKKSSCNCLGVNALKQNSCNFPGLGEAYDPAIDETDPVEPTPAGDDPASQQLFQLQMSTYQQELAELEIARGQATSKAEAIIRPFHENLNWAFVDKESDDYNRTLATTWAAQGVIMLVVFLFTVLLQKRRDVA